MQMAHPSIVVDPSSFNGEYRDTWHKEMSSPAESSVWISPESIMPFRCHANGAEEQACCPSHTHFPAQADSKSIACTWHLALGKGGDDGSSLLLPNLCTCTANPASPLHKQLCPPISMVGQVLKSTDWVQAGFDLRATEIQLNGHFRTTFIFHDPPLPSHVRYNSDSLQGDDSLILFRLFLNTIRSCSSSHPDSSQSHSGPWSPLPV